MKQHAFDAVVVGGGLAGLTVATFLARDGKSVTLLEKSRHPGGRAITEQQHGFKMNLGPHALYKNGAAYSILRELGIHFTGKSPSGKNGYAIKHGRLHRLPYNAKSLVSTSLFQSWKARLELLNFFRKLPRIRTDSLQDQTLHNWMSRNFRHDEVRDFISMILRVSTYTNDADRMSAGAAIEQLQIARAGNVLYIDGGWQVLVDGLRQAAENAGVKIVSHSKATAVNVRPLDRGVTVSNGDHFPAKDIVLAIGPEDASQLLSSNLQIQELTRRLIPVKMAALTVGLKRLPAPKRLLAFGIDSPFYLSVHSEWAKLTETKESAVIHTGKYLHPEENSDPELNRAELEQVLDLCQAGWRDELVAYSYLPRMKVANAAVTATGNGMTGRMNMNIPDVKGLYLCGDWIGQRGMLSDASLASAKAVSEKILHDSVDTFKEESHEIVRSA